MCPRLHDPEQFPFWSSTVNEGVKPYEPEVLSNCVLLARGEYPTLVAQTGSRACMVVSAYHMLYSQTGCKRVLALPLSGHVTLGV